MATPKHGEEVKKMAHIRYAVDSRDGFTAEFSVSFSSTEQVLAEARKIVTESFPGSVPGPYEVWDLEQDVHVGSFS